VVSALIACIPQFRLKNQIAGNHEWCKVKTFILACAGTRDDLT
jgi:hypothetical protein